MQFSPRRVMLKRRVRNRQNGDGYFKDFTFYYYANDFVSFSMRVCEGINPVSHAI